MSAFEGKADMTYCGISLSRSLLGAKRTLLVAPHTSAFDLKRTSARRSTACARAEVCGRLCVYLVRERFYRWRFFLADNLATFF